jgi:hypothetical protein
MYPHPPESTVLTVSGGSSSVNLLLCEGGKYVLTLVTCETHQPLQGQIVIRSLRVRQKQAFSSACCAL